MKHAKIIFNITCFFTLFLTFTGFAVENSLSVQFINAFGQHKKSPVQLKEPKGISADRNQNVYVSDTGNNRIVKYDATGRLLAFIGGFGWEREQFQQPMGLFVYNVMDVFVADYQNDRIVRYDKDLNWIMSFKPDAGWEAQYQFAFPKAVSLSLHGDFFIIDGEHSRIIKLNSSFVPQTSFGDYDWGKGMLSNPESIAISRQDNVFVSDSDAGVIKVYDYYGSFLYDIGTDFLSEPAGICVDELGNIFIADRGLDKIFAFNNQGHLLLQYGSSGEQYGAFQFVSDVTVSHNMLFTADTNNNRIQVFKIVENEGQVEAQQ